MNTTFETGLVKCRCRNCDRKIEFSADEVGREATCPHCGMETLLFIPTVTAITNAGVRKTFPSPGGEGQGEGERSTIPSLRRVRKIALVSFCVLAAIATVVFFIIRSPLFAQYAGGAAGALIVVAVVALIVLWAVLWIVFPVFVYFGMGRMEKLLRQIEFNTRQQ